MRTALTAMCALTLLAVVSLTGSVLILQPPRLDYGRAMFNAALFTAQSGLTLLVVAGIVSNHAVRWLLIAGAVAIVLVGGLAVRSTLTGPHFEGYAIVLGSMLVVQGALTIGWFVTGSGRWPPARTGLSESLNPAR